MGPAFEPRFRANRRRIARRSAVNGDLQTSGRETGKTNKKNQAFGSTRNLVGRDRARRRSAPARRWLQPRSKAERGRAGPLGAPVGRGGPSGPALPRKPDRRASAVRQATGIGLQWP